MSRRYNFLEIFSSCLLVYKHEQSFAVYDAFPVSA